MVYDFHNRSNIYLLSNTEELAKYDVFKNKWNNLNYDPTVYSRINKAPILWLEIQIQQSSIGFNHVKYHWKVV